MHDTQRHACTHNTREHNATHMRHTCTQEHTGTLVHLDMPAHATSHMHTGTHRDTDTAHIGHGCICADTRTHVSAHTRSFTCTYRHVLGVFLEIGERHLKVQVSAFPLTLLFCSFWNFVFKSAECVTFLLKKCFARERELSFQPAGTSVCALSHICGEGTPRVSWRRVQLTRPFSSETANGF